MEISSMPTYIFSCPDKIHPKCCKLEFHYRSFWLGNHFVTFILDKTLIGAKISQTKINSSRLLKLCRSKPKKTFIQSAASYRFIFVHCVAWKSFCRPRATVFIWIYLSLGGKYIIHAHSDAKGMQRDPTDVTRNA